MSDYKPSKNIYYYIHLTLSTVYLMLDLIEYDPFKYLTTYAMHVPRGKYVWREYV